MDEEVERYIRNLEERRRSRNMADDRSRRYQNNRLSLIQEENEELFDSALV